MRKDEPQDEPVDNHSIQHTQGETTMSTEKTPSKFQELMNRFDDMPGTKMVTKLTEASTTVVGTIILNQVGANTGFEVKNLPEATIQAIYTAAGITVDTKTASKHTISQAVAKVLRMAKEQEMTIKEAKYVIMNKPSEGNRPSKWALFSL